MKNQEFEMYEKEYRKYKNLNYINKLVEIKKEFPIHIQLLFLIDISFVSFSALSLSVYGIMKICQKLKSKIKN